jgi:zinc finger CCHC domain-containing protein 8
VDSRSPHRRQRSCERTLERTDRDRCTGFVADLVRDSGECQGTDVTECLFFSDKQGHPDNYPHLLSPPLYERCTAKLLGANEEDESSLDASVGRCFNCGSAYHTVSSCLVPHNTELITLSRQMYNFFKPARTTEPMTISAATEFTNQRHQWLRSFEPGQIRGPKLREALGLREDDVGFELPWLKNMADWGYPSGWFSEEDPREQVLRRIDSLFAEPLDLGGGDHFLAIFGDEATEILDISSVQHFRNSSGDGDTDKSQYSAMRLDRTEQAEMERDRRRWARYPSTYFSCDLLPIYNGARLLPILPTSSSTFTGERHLLWERILEEVDSSRTPHAPHDSGNVHQYVHPPPPIASPPPLPPLLPPAETDHVLQDRESDMELSDSDC